VKIFLVTSKDKIYNKLADKCVKSAKNFNVNVEKFYSIPINDLHTVAKNNNSFLKYAPSEIENNTDYVKRLCPIKRISNGLTHYLLYCYAAKNKKSICILESDSLVIRDFPEPIINGVIQISSHKADQMTAKALFNSGRSKKFKLAEPQKYKIWAENFNWKCCDSNGIIKHPLTGTHGTSGYIIGYKAASKLVEYFSKDGIGFADRVREDHIGEGNLYLQVPQSVIVPRHGYVDNSFFKKTQYLKLKSLFKKSI
jgi:hypothetical protein